MDREERRRKFNEAVINLLYPPPPSPPQEDNNEDILATITLWEDFNSESVPVADKVDHDDSCSSSSSTEDDVEEKLSRAQRKRLRKKKLKESASHMRMIIGSFLPGEDNVTTVRRNVDEKVGVEIEKHGGEESADGTNKTKMKQRRKAKRLAKEEVKSTIAHELNQGPESSSTSENLI